MSRAFVKEDIEIPERITRRRSASGLPPGALNLITAAGAAELRSHLANLAVSGQATATMSHLKETLASATIVEPRPLDGEVAFGSTISLQNEAGETVHYRITGVDEVDLAPENVSWVSPLGKTLLNASLGQRLRLAQDDQTMWTVVQVK